MLALESLGIIGKNQTKKNLSVNIIPSQTVEQGASGKWQVSISNDTRKNKNTIVKIIAKGVNIAQVDENESSLSVYSSDEVQIDFGDTWSSTNGLIWRPGIIKKGGATSISFIGLPTAGSGDQATVKAIAYELKQEGNRCGFLWLRKCNINITETKINEQEVSATVGAVSQRRDAITLGKGYNLVTIPVILNDITAGRFWSQFTKPVGWHLDSSSQSWHNLAESQYYKDMKPGVGMWLYHPNGGEILIPDGDSPDPDSTYDLKLSVGWNQIGNPYKYRIKLDGDKILVKRSGKDTITLSGAIEEGTLSNLLGAATTQATTESVAQTSYIQLVMGRYLPIGSAFFINTKEAVTLAFPGKSIFAPGELISAVEKAKIISWINSNGLDVCGNEPSSDISSDPLRDNQTGEILDQFDCVLIKHPERPWNG